jgi:hypothetical protein
VKSLVLSTAAALSSIFLGPNLSLTSQRSVSSIADYDHLSENLRMPLSKAPENPQSFVVPATLRQAFPPHKH